MSGFRLRCSRCDRTAEAIPLAALCAECDGVQLVAYDESIDDLRPRWRSRDGGMWRFREWLPLRAGEQPVSLGEGGTPLVPLPRTGARLELDLRVKDEGGNPTGSFKDRGISAAVTRAVHDGAKHLVVPSAGNAGVALAAYAARAGVPATIFLPADTPARVSARCAAYGAELRPVDGLLSDCGPAAATYAAQRGAFDVSTLREPYRVEGKKTMGLEILEALEWTPPDAIVYPTGGGTGLIGAWKAAVEADACGWLSGPLPRMYAVQPAGCAPIVRAFDSNERVAAPWEGARTAAWGLRVPSARGDAIMLDILRRSGGGAIAVDEEQMLASTHDLPRADGMLLGIEGGAALAGVEALRRRGDLTGGERVVMFNTGNLANY